MLGETAETHWLKVRRTDGRCLLIIHEEAGSIVGIISHVPSDCAGELELGIPCNNQRHNRLELSQLLFDVSFL